MGATVDGSADSPDPEETSVYLTQPLHRAVQQHPDRVAVRFGSRQRTSREFCERVARLAGALQKLGMQVGDRVAMLSLNSDRYLEYQMAVPWGGGVMNPCNTRWSAAEILYSLDDSGSSILLVDETFRPLVEQFRRDSSTLREVVYCGDGDVPAGMHGYEALLAAADPVPDAARRGEDLAGIFYTGGTTGFPKGVMLSHTNLCSSALALHAERPGRAWRYLPACRPDVPSGGHGVLHGALDRGQYACRRSGIQPRIGARHPRARPRHASCCWCRP